MNRYEGAARHQYAERPDRISVTDNGAKLEIDHDRFGLTVVPVSKLFIGEQRVEFLLRGYGKVLTGTLNGDKLDFVGGTFWIRTSRPVRVQPAGLGRLAPIPLPRVRELAGPARATCKTIGCQMPSWNGQPDQYCSIECRDRDQELAGPARATCKTIGCKMPSWNGQPDQYCSIECKDRDQATFERSNFKDRYEKERKLLPGAFTEAWNVITDFLRKLREVFPRVSDIEVDSVIRKLDDFWRVQKKFSRASEMGAFIWTCQDKLGGREVCSYVNQAIREDKGPLFDLVVPLVRLINMLLVTRGGGIANQWPPENRTYRGSAVPRWALEFFTPERWYRVSMFLATSFSQETALGFAIDNQTSEMAPVLFVIEFDLGRRCEHANYLEGITDAEGEKEFLLPPYSVFQVLRHERPLAHPHALDGGLIQVISIRAHHDNQDESLERRLPTSPWH